MTTTIEKEDSFRYELDYKEKNKTLIIRTNTVLFNEALKLFNKVRPEYIEYFVKSCGPFTPPGSKYGYSEAFEIKQQDDQVEFKTTLPIIASKSRQERCGFKMDNSVAMAILASMSLLLVDVLWIAHGNLPIQPGEQIISFQTILLEPGLGGFGLSCILHPRLFRTVNKLEESNKRAISLVMANVERFMFPVRNYPGSCWIDIGDNNRVHFNVTGDATGLDPNSAMSRPDSCYLSPHNVDSPLQALTLIVGLIELEKSIRALEKVIKPPERN